MQIAIYAIREAEKWNCYLSLDMRADLQWWYGRMRKADERAGTPFLVLLSSRAPLGWAVEIQAKFQPVPDMDRWERPDWLRYMYRALSPFLLQEPESSRSKWSVLLQEIQLLDGTYLSSLIEKGAILVGWDALVQQAELLIECMAGRALLAGEVEALLGEVAVGTGDWRAAAQLGVLLGRLRLEAGLAQPAPRKGPGWLRRRAMALRCRRCGSEAKSRTACAACGSAACAYCEACLAMGRSRACALLLHGTVGSAVRGTAGGSPHRGLGPVGA